MSSGDIIIALSVLILLDLSQRKPHVSRRILAQLLGPICSRLSTHTKRYSHFPPFEHGQYHPYRVALATCGPTANIARISTERRCPKRASVTRSGNHVTKPSNRLPWQRVARRALVGPIPRGAWSRALRPGIALRQCTPDLVWAPVGVMPYQRPAFAWLWLPRPCEIKDNRATHTHTNT